MSKKYTGTDVMTSARKRMDFIFGHFERIYIAFSGGKDSGVMLNLALEAARRHGRLPLDVLFIDLEAQYRHTIDYVTGMMGDKRINPHWICLPLRLRNAVSQINPHWLCWDEAKREAWVREIPRLPGVISDKESLPFFKAGMEFENFVADFGDWFSRGKKTACLIGIRADESLNRYSAIRNGKKETFRGKIWSTRISRHLFNFYPLYDWRTEDLWIANGKMNWRYNKIYDLMHLAGVSIHKMRLCQPYGDDQRTSLRLFRILEPETWTKVAARVEGANFGSRYAGNAALGNYRVVPPKGHTYKTYAKFLLRTMPSPLARRYRRKILKLLLRWKENRKEHGHEAMSLWRHICKALLRNDYLGRRLSYKQMRKEARDQLDMIAKYMKF